MNLFITTLCLTLSAAFANDMEDQRSLQLATAWALAQPNITYSEPTTQFVVTYDHGSGGASGTGATVQEVFFDCPDGPDAADTAATTDLTTNVDLTITPGGASYNSVWTFTVNPNITESTAWSSIAGSGKGTAEFCIRVGLVNAGGEIVNFKQTAITINYDLEGAFAVTDFYTKAIGAEDDTTRAKDIGNGTAYLCSTLTQPFDQDDIICIEVCPPSTLYTTVSPFLELTASLGGVAENLLSTANAEQLSAYNCNFGKNSNCCQLHFKLDGWFFPTSANTVTVTVAGRSNWDALRRRRSLLRLSDGRGLQDDVVDKDEEVAGAFAVDIDLARPEESAGAPGVMLTNVIAAAGAAGAAILL